MKHKWRKLELDEIIEEGDYFAMTIDLVKPELKDKPEGKTLLLEAISDKQIGKRVQRSDLLHYHYSIVRLTLGEIEHIRADIVERKLEPEL